MRETGRGLLHSRKSSDGLNGRSRRHHAGFGAAQCGNPAHARVNAVQAITVESDGQKILEIEHHQSIKTYSAMPTRKAHCWPLRAKFQNKTNTPATNPLMIRSSANPLWPASCASPSTSSAMPSPKMKRIPAPLIDSTELII